MDVLIPAERVPVVEEADICVVGGSCTGLFAAVRAARLGAKVCIVERQNRFGGVACSGLVNMWHSVYNADFSKQIIAGLTFEVMERLAKRDAITKFKDTKDYALPLNTEELTIELDELAREASLRILFHSFFAGVVKAADGAVDAILVQTKSGRAAVKAKAFVDATGDGDLCAAAGLELRVPTVVQPPTTCAKFTGWNFKEGVDVYKILLARAGEFNLPNGFMWGAHVPSTNNAQYMLSGTRVTGKNPAFADDLNFCELEGRRQIRAIGDILRKEFGKDAPQLAALPSCIGIRESRHVCALKRITGDELLRGVRFSDAIGNGTYPVDIHHQDKPGITFKHFDGTQTYHRFGLPPVHGRWREPSAENPTSYQIPLGVLLPKGSKNVFAAGRMLDADAEAYAGLRVMVNLNQTGEAAGVAAWHCLSSGRPACEADAQAVRKSLAEGGSCVE